MSKSKVKEFREWKVGEPLETETKRFKLRPLTPEDADDVYTSWWNDAEIQKGFNSKPRNWTLKDAEKHLAQFNNDTKFHFGIFDKETGDKIGFFAIFPDKKHKVAKSNVCLGDKNWWGKGVVGEVRGHFLDFIFNRLGMEKLAGEIKGRNLSSIYNYKAMGFTAEAVRRGHTLGIDGGRDDVFMFGLLKREWEASQKKKSKKA